MPSRTYISKKEKTQPGFKVSKDRITLLLGGSAKGNFKLKPMLDYRSPNHRALKGYNHRSYPIMWQFSLRCLNISKDNKDGFLNVSLPSGMIFSICLFLLCSL
jgi:hypothetical protein